MKWLKELFKWPEDHPASEAPPRMIIETPKNISEPIISFAETFKANPKRFKCKQIDLKERDKELYSKINFDVKVSRYRLTDNYEKISWEFNLESWAMRDYISNEITGIPMITRDEGNYLYEIMNAYFSNQMWKKADIELHRYRRPLRRKLMDIYCK